MSLIEIPETEVIVPNRTYIGPGNEGNSLVYDIFRYRVPTIDETVDYLRNLLERKREDEEEFSLKRNLNGDEREEFDGDELTLLGDLAKLPMGEQEALLEGMSAIGDVFPYEKIGEPGASYLDIGCGAVERTHLTGLMERSEYVTGSDYMEIVGKKGVILWTLGFKTQNGRIGMDRRKLETCLIDKEVDSADFVCGFNAGVSYRTVAANARGFYDLLSRRVNDVGDMTEAIEYEIMSTIIEEFAGALNGDVEEGVEPDLSAISPN